MSICVKNKIALFAALSCFLAVSIFCTMLNLCILVLSNTLVYLI